MQMERFAAPHLSAFFCSSSAAALFCSTAYTQPASACSAISMDTEPVPAPMSQQTASRVSCNLDKLTDRTSLLVMGTTASPSALRKNASSGIPWVTTTDAVGFSISTTLSGA